MSPTRVLTLATLSLLAGGALLFYVVGNVPPTTDGQALDPTALLLGFGGIFLITAGAGVLVALFLHRRWPANRKPGAAAPRRRPSSRPFARGFSLAWPS